MQRAPLLALALALALLAAPVQAFAGSADMAEGIPEDTAAVTECQSCTARHRSLQALQRARTDGACPDDATVPCAQGGVGLPVPDDDSVLRLPDGQLVGAQD